MIRAKPLEQYKEDVRSIILGELNNSEKFDALVGALYEFERDNSANLAFCGVERPPRKTLCQLQKDHKGSHQAVVFWETVVPESTKEKKE